MMRRAVFWLTLLMLWEGAARSGLWPSQLLPGPLAVLTALIDGLRSGLLVRGAVVSLSRLALGFGLSLVLGLMLGVLLTRVRWLDDTLGSLILGLQALPSVCWLPLALLWFGLDDRAIVFVVVMGALPSITLGVAAGAKQVPPTYLQAAQNLGASGLGLYTQVILPAAKPAILAGVKQGWSFGWRALMAAELLYQSLGLGNLLQPGRDLNDTARLVAVMLVIVALVVAIDRLMFAPAERRIRERWGLRPAGGAS